MAEVYEIIDKELSKVGYEPQDCWFLRGNILRELKLGGYEIKKAG